MLLLLAAARPPARCGAQPARSLVEQAGAAAGAEDGVALLAPARLRALPAAERAAWSAYLARSRELARRDRAALAAELRATGRAHMVAAPYVAYFTLQPTMRGAWFGSAPARALARRLVTWQTPSGGWSKHVDMGRRDRAAGESYYGESDAWSYIATIDNDATVTQLRILGGVVDAAGAGPDAEPLRAALLRGLDYLFAARFPNGCYPQVYPLQGGYHDAATFNDNATVNVLRLLRDVASGQYRRVPPAARERARAGFEQGIDCLLRSQVVVAGVRTVWGQQHDPLTLRPVPARSYELAGLSGRESAAILDLLMELPRPDARVSAAVRAGAAWLEAHAIRGFAYDAERGLRRQPGAGPIWARLTEPETDRPIFANRDGIRLYDWSRLTDRRTGYAWFGTEPAGTLQTYQRWARQQLR